MVAKNQILVGKIQKMYIYALIMYNSLCVNFLGNVSGAGTTTITKQNIV